MSTPPDDPDGRVAWVDNLRVCTIAGVIVVHTATAYVTDIADWYYSDELRPTTLGLVLFAVPALMGGLFGLGPLFWLAGRFSVPSLRHRGPARFSVSRVVRLGAPLAVFVAVVNPAADLVGDLRRGPRPFVDYLAETEFSVAWFVAALLFCSLGYAGLRAVVPAREPARRPGTRGALAAAGLIAGTGVVTWPVTSLTDDHLMNLRPGAWPQGAVLFALGVLAGEASEAAGRGAVDVGLDRRVERRWGWLTAAAMIALVSVIGLGSQGGDLAGLLHETAWPEVSFALLYGLVSVAFSLWCLSWFGRRWTGSRSWSEPAGRASYATYLLHPLVLTAVMVAAWWLPGGPEVKFLVVAVTGVPICFLAGHALTRLPGARRVL